MTALSIMFLFGGDHPWSPSDWTDSDDRVRGGSSYSELSCNSADPIATFRGDLDIKTLGGAGFASQRTTGEDRCWDISKYDGILLDIKECDEKRYTLTLKDELLPRSSNGREQSTVSWEYDFKPERGEKVYVLWDDLKPTYRGREKKDAKPLDLKNVKRVSLMMRRYSSFPPRGRALMTDLASFGTQEGAFSLSIKSIATFKKFDTEQLAPYQDHPNRGEVPQFVDAFDKAPTSRSQQGWLRRLFGHCAGS